MTWSQSPPRRPQSTAQSSCEHSSSGVSIAPGRFLLSDEFIWWKTVTWPFRDAPYFHTCVWPFPVLSRHFAPSTELLSATYHYLAIRLAVAGKTAISFPTTVLFIYLLGSHTVSVRVWRLSHTRCRCQSFLKIAQHPTSSRWSCSVIQIAAFFIDFRSVISADVLPFQKDCLDSECEYSLIDAYLLS